MKTQVIQLESHDDVLSIHDKMAWSKARRLVLVWPRRGSLLENRLDLVRIQRYSQQLGAQLALVTHQSDVIDYAQELGLPVFETPLQAQQRTWRRGRNRRKPVHRREHAAPDLAMLRRELTVHVNPKPEPAWLRGIAFTLAILSVLALASLFIPDAKITIQMPVVEQSLTFPIRIDPNLSAPNLTGGVPAQAQKVVVEASQEMQASGTDWVGVDFARGEVLLGNLTGNAVQVPAGTIVENAKDPIQRFVVVNDLEVPAGAGQTVDAQVKAVLPGSAGNLPADSVRAVEGSLGLALSVNNPSGFTGGADQRVNRPTSLDEERLRATLLESLKAAALKEVQTQARENQLVVPGHAEMLKVLKQTREPAADLPGDHLRLTMQVEFEVWTVTLADLKTLASETLDAIKPAQQIAVPDSLFLAPLGEPEQTEGSLHWQIHAARRLQPAWTQDQVRAWVVGRKPEQAALILQNQLGLAQPAQVNLRPNGWPFMPFLGFQIETVAQ